MGPGERHDFTRGVTRSLQLPLPHSQLDSRVGKSQLDSAKTAHRMSSEIQPYVFDPESEEEGEMAQAQSLPDRLSMNVSEW